MSNDANQDRGRQNGNHAGGLQPTNERGEQTNNGDNNDLIPGLFQVVLISAVPPSIDPEFMLNPQLLPQINEQGAVRPIPVGIAIQQFQSIDTENNQQRFVRVVETAAMNNLGDNNPQQPQLQDGGPGGEVISRLLSAIAGVVVSPQVDPGLHRVIDITVINNPGNENPSQNRVQTQFYRNGFRVNDGPLRSYTAQENQTFLDAIRVGNIPPEFTDTADQVVFTIEDNVLVDYR